MIIRPFCAFLMLTSFALSEYKPKEEEECNGPNEWYDCESSFAECKKICKNKDYKGICFMDCWPACICKLGYFRLGDNDRSKCVLKKDCPGGSKSKATTIIKKLTTLSPLLKKPPPKQTTKLTPKLTPKLTTKPPAKKG